MRHTQAKAFYFAPLLLGLSLLFFAPGRVDAQAELNAEIEAFVLRAYNAYQQRDAETLFALHSQISPYFAEFKQTIPLSFAPPNVRIEGKRMALVKAKFSGDRGELRLVVNMYARDLDTGGEAEGFPEFDHTFYLVREQGVWKIWRFVVTAEEFAGNYLTAPSDAARAELIAKAHPVTYGFLKGLEEAARDLLEVRGDDVHAAEMFQIELRLGEEAKSDWGIGGAQAGLGDVYFARGDYRLAADNYQQVLTLAERLGVKEGVAAMSVKMGNLHLAQGNVALAMDLYRESVRIYEEMGSKIEITYPLANLGNAYFAEGDFAKALDQYQKILKLYEQLHSRAGAAWLRNQIADVYAAQGKNELALATYQLSLNAHEELGNKPMQAYALTGIGRIRLGEGKVAEAVGLFTRAAGLARAGNALELLWKVLYLLGQAHRAQNNAAQAQTAFTESIAVIEQLRSQAAGTERDRERSFENKTAPYLAMVESLVEQKKLPEALAYAERAKARMLLDVLRDGRADITKSMTVEERARESSLTAALNVLSSQLRQESLLPRPNPAKLAELNLRLQQARLEFEAYETRINAAYPKLRVQRGENAPLTLTEAEALLPNATTALLEYVVTPRQTFLFVLTRPKLGDAIYLGPVELKVISLPIAAEELARRVTEFRVTLARNSMNFKEAAAQLYDLLLRPAQRELEGKTVVGIVPSDQLWELPFQSLMSAPKRYFIQDQALFYAPSLSVLREMRMKEVRPSATASASAHAPAPSLLALGNPALSDRLRTRTRLRDGSISLAALPEAEREVNTLGQMYGPRDSKILTGSAASEEVVKTEAGRFPILHFATHGVLDDKNPLYSRLMLANTGGSEDGMLEAREIMRLDLRTDLVVLSACQTARGEFGAGEGMIGMSWAFFIAGASTTVVSQWQVDSTSTAQLMVEFHRVLRAGGATSVISKAEAMRAASLTLMADPKYAHPFYWSGFVVVGNGM
jgi:CHAT domain-containing protein